MTPQFINSRHFKDYWERGNGKELLESAECQPNIKTFHKYIPLFNQIDDLGDEVVKETYLKMPYQDASALINKYSTTPLTNNQSVSPNIRDFFMQLQTVPDWFNVSLANHGAKFCMRTGPSGLIILRDFTLMGGYDFAYLSKALIKTGVLKKGAVKRLKETLDFWINVTRENALSTNSKAYQLIIRTRLMHSYARLKIKEKSDWDFENWGEPINSWDMIATYTGFTLVFIQGLQKLGIKISSEEEEGLYHLWKYIGYLLGIPPDYLPNNRIEAVEQFYYWTSLQSEGDEDSTLLAQALLQENLDNTIYNMHFQRKILLKLHQSTNWFLLDKEINQRLQIPKVTIPYSLFPRIIKKANIISQKIYFRNEKGYRKLVEMGSKQQMGVLEDYVKHSPKDFHY